MFACARLLPAVSALLLVASVAGCSPGHGHAAVEKTDITVADFPSIDSAGLYIAEMNGLFRAQGLNVKIVEDFKGSQDTVDGIEKGTSDISSADYVTYLD